MNDNEKVAALAAAVAGMRAEREWYRAAWLEATSQRDDLQARNATLEHIKASQHRYIGQYQEVLKERQSQLDLAEAALQECSVDEMNWNRERDGLETELEHAQNTVARLTEERDDWQEGALAARARVSGRERKNRQLRDQLAAECEWREHMNEDWKELLKQRDDLIAWWQDAREAE